MSRPASFLRSAIKLIALAALPLIVASCAADLNPSPAPTGYKYSGQQFNAPWTGPVKPMTYPGMGSVSANLQPAPADMATPMAPMPGAPAQLAPPSGPMPTYNPGDQSAVTPNAGGPGVSPVWHQAAADLLTRTEHDFGRMRDAVYIRPPVTPDETAFAKALTDTMRQRNYKISMDLQKSAFMADYSIRAADTAGQTTLTLKINGQDGHLLQQEKGDYAVNGVPAPMTTALATPQSSTQAAPPPPFWTGNASSMPSSPVAQDLKTAPSPAPAYSQQPPQIPATAGSVATGNGTTYIYDTRATRPAGHTAYEQLQGVEHVVGRTSELADR